MEQKKNLMFFISLGSLLLLSLGLGALFSFSRANPAEPLMLVEKGHYYAMPGALAGLKAAASLYAGDYPAVKQVLQGRSLSESELGMLSRAQLALGEKPVLMSAGYQDTPLGEGMRALYLAGQGYYRSAGEILRQVLPRVTTGRTALEIGLAQVLAQQGSIAEAEQVLNGITPGPLASPSLQAVQGDMALRQGEDEKAWQLYSKVKVQGHLADDPLFETKMGIAALGSGHEVHSIAVEVRELDPAGGLGDYLEAESSLQAGDFGGANRYFTAALAKKLPEKMRDAVDRAAREVEVRLQAEPRIRALGG